MNDRHTRCPQDHSAELAASRSEETLTFTRLPTADHKPLVLPCQFLPNMLILRGFLMCYAFR
jgi:hypothetical protein